ncbi:MAG: M28 family peptidase [Muribaculaceae bacterium]|nr:M28 family peptidase [Muribaculaceae bacterium]
MRKDILWIGLAMLACAGCSGAAVRGNAGATEAAEASQAFSDNAVADADSLYAFVERQVELGPRCPGSEAHRECGSLIVNTLKGYGVDSVAVQRAWVTTFEGKRYEACNILGSINPGCDRRVLLVAHYDTRPWADNDPDEAMHTRAVTGANDGASGVAVLLETARLLGRDVPGNVGIDLLFVDMEDSGENGGDEDSWCLGTQEWVKAMPYTLTNRPKYGILLDMVGGHDARFYREYFSEQGAAAHVDRIWAVARESGYGDRFVNRRGGGVVDDHLFITRAGIPCVDIIECVNEHTGSFNPTWHTVSDTMDGIDRNTLKAVAQTVINAVLQ